VEEAQKEGTGVNGGGDSLVLTGKEYYVGARVNRERGAGMTDTVNIDPTIIAGVAEELYEIEDGEGYDGWVRVYDQYIYNDRWHHNYWLVLQRAGDHDAYWGLFYQIGLTEYQEDKLPWHGHSRDAVLKLERLYQFTSIEYHPHRTRG
jgi:hypothetical protein